MGGRHILVDQFVPRNAHTPASYAYLSAFPRLESVIFPGNLARTLYKNHTASFAFADLAPLLAALRPAPLRTLILDVIRDTTYAKGFTAYVPASAPPVAGLQGLEKLRLGWRVHDAKGAPPGNAYARLAALVRPSLTTLVHLELDIDQDRRRPAPFDLTQLRDAAPTLRTLRYQTQYDDTNVLDTITTLFPLLERLCLKWDAYWKRARIGRAHI
ncbi:hypothetical protein PLICRDRAFT_37283 [Plicaturopsis crispa FD-325 SS-3]|nr:hypothetical protein PLICRDRAFT_37283 [Plicaturopsis crispa FD-325 SS-3]